MTFLKFNTKDNAQSTLLTSITSSTTSITLDWWGSLFPTSNFIITIQEVTGWVVVKSEKALCTSRSWDTLTVTRWYDGSTAVSFSAWDFVSLFVTSAIITDIQDEVTRLETDKLNKAGATRTGLTAHRLYYSNSTGVETALAYWTSWQVLQSNWATSNPSWVAPSVDIAWQTLVTPTTTDELIVYRPWIGNRKITALADTTQRWLVQQATDAEAGTGTENTKYITSKVIWDYTKSACFTYTFTATTAQVITHWLGRTPKNVELHVVWDTFWPNSSEYRQTASEWYRDWTNQRCVYQWANSRWVANELGYIDHNGTKQRWFAVSSAWSTNITVTGTRAAWSSWVSLLVIIS